MSTFVIILLGILTGMALYLVLGPIVELSRMKARNEKKLEELERGNRA